MAENDLAKRTLTLKKKFDAPIDLVWEAWTQPEHVAQWWGPKEWQLKSRNTTLKSVENGNM